VLPFLKRKNEGGIAGTIIKNRTPDKDSDSKDLDDNYSLEDCAEKIIKAVHSADKTALASALKEAFNKLESEPHVEGEHVSPHTYEAQNIKAAKED